MLEANIDKINWSYLSENPAAIHLLEANLDKINWGYLSMNPAIVEIDTELYKKQLTIKDKQIELYKNKFTGSKRKFIFVSGVGGIIITLLILL